MQQQQHQQQQQQQQHHHRQGVLSGPPSANTPTSGSGGAHHRQSPLQPPPPSHRQSPHHRQSPLPAAQAASSPLPPQHHLHHRQSPHSLPPSAVSPPDQRYPPAGVNLYQKARTAERRVRIPVDDRRSRPAAASGPSSRLFCGIHTLLAAVRSDVFVVAEQTQNDLRSPASSASVTVSDLSLLSVAATTVTSVPAHQMQPLDLGVKDSSSSSSSTYSSSSSSGPPILHPAVPPPTLSSSAQLTATELVIKRKWPIDENSSGLPGTNEEDLFEQEVMLRRRIVVVVRGRRARLRRRLCPSLYRRPKRRRRLAQRWRRRRRRRQPRRRQRYQKKLRRRRWRSRPLCKRLLRRAVVRIRRRPKYRTSAIDSEKSNSPKPPTYGGHKLKKAWLQRHSGEDVNDEKTSGSKTVGTTSSSSSVNGSPSISNNDNDGTTVPPSTTGLRANSPSAQTTVTTKDSNNDMSALTSLNNSINSIGSMAVNSISKSKPAKGAGGKKAAAAASTPAASSKDRASPVVLNGHVSPKSNARAAAAAAAASSYASDESSSSETESSSTTTTRSSPKRVPPKVKRKKALRKTAIKKAPARKSRIIAAAPAVEKRRREVAAEAAAPTTRKIVIRVNAGRRPKVSGSYSPAGGKDGTAPGNGASGGAGGDAPKEKKFRDDKDQKDPFTKPPISQLKKTGESFLQDGPCFEVAPKLRYTKNGQLAIAGFSDPHKDATQEDLSLWLPDYTKPPTDLDLEMARFMLSQVGDQFCDLLTQETEAINIHISEGRKNGTIKIWGEVGKDRDDLSWLLCTNRQAHEQEKLMLTQIIAGDSLMKLKKLAHESRAMWEVPMYCGCDLSQTETVPPAGNGICKEILRNLKQEKQRKAQQQVNGGVV
ncbi:Lysine-specific demethylase 3B [Sarracenia purpurea var. burkii]